jgi:hypothetical protein
LRKPWIHNIDDLFNCCGLGSFNANESPFRIIHINAGKEPSFSKYSAEFLLPPKSPSIRGRSREATEEFDGV